MACVQLLFTICSNPANNSAIQEETSKMRRMRQMKKKKNLNTLELNIVFLGTCVYVPKSSWVKSSCLENILQSL